MLTARAKLTRQRQQRLTREQQAVFSRLRAKLEPLGDAGATRWIGVVSSLVNVYPGEPPKPEQLDSAVKLNAGRRESESAQIVISAGQKPVRVTRVHVSDLKLRRGASFQPAKPENRKLEGYTTEIPANHVEVRLVGYTDVEESSWRGSERLGLWHDPLLRLRPFECPAGRARSLWMTVRVPDDAAAGEYAGSVELLCEGESLARLPVEVKVADFTLPDAPRMHTSYWSNFSTRYDSTNDEAILADAIRMFGAYRVSTRERFPSPSRRHDPGPPTAGAGMFAATLPRDGG